MSSARMIAGSAIGLAISASLDGRCDGRLAVSRRGAPLARRSSQAGSPRPALRFNPLHYASMPRVPPLLRGAGHGRALEGAIAESSQMPWEGGAREQDWRCRQEKIARAQRSRNGYTAGMLGSGSKVRVRSGKPADAVALARIFKEAWLLAYRGIIPHLHLESMVRQRSPEWWRDALKSGDSALVLE